VTVIVGAASMFVASAEAMTFALGLVTPVLLSALDVPVLAAPPPLLLWLQSLSGAERLLCRLPFFRAAALCFL